MAITEGTYSTDYLNQIMGSQYQFPVEELALFNIALKKYNDKAREQGIGEIVEITLESAVPGGGTQFRAETITFPESGTLAAMPISSLPGTSAIGHTYAFYDEYSVVVHELSHFILDLFGSVYFNDHTYLDNELNQAVLAYAWSKSNGNLDTLKDLLISWSPAVKREYAKLSGASFENLFNNNRSFYSDVAGISNASNLQRIGYQTYQNYDTPEREWHSFGDDRASIPGNYNYILEHDSEGIVVLGNQYDNNSATRENGLIGTKYRDYLDGGDGNDFLRGNAGDDTLIGGDGSDGLYGDDGDDTLYGGRSDRGDDGDADTLVGGTGFDTYIAGSGDTIIDEDGSGAMYLGGEHLDGGEKKVIKHIEVTTTNYTKAFIYCECKTVTKWSDVQTTDEWVEEAEEFYLDEATGTKYILSGSTLSIISSAGTITINNFSNGQLGIHLGEKETIDKKNVERDVFLEEDFCSPLILDINNNGTSSTGLGNSQTYFDMDGDGFKERTAWVEQGDGMLVLDRNGNGTIDNGTELFGNFTPLASGNSASDGFEALLQYDENHDGKIDRNDAAYNQLKVWMDDNQNTIYYVEDYNQIQSVFKHKDLAA